MPTLTAPARACTVSVDQPRVSGFPICRQETMVQHTQPIMRRALAASVVLLLLCCGLLGAFAWQQLPGERRAAAQSRWAARPFTAYRVALRVEYLNRVCFQEIEVQGERVRRVIRDTCLTSSFASMTVPRLYEISTRIEQAPTCYPDSQPCACRIMRIGRIEYDPRLGYPREIAYRRAARPNWTHLDFWKHLWLDHELPNCGPSRLTHIVVLAFAPLL